MTSFWGELKRRNVVRVAIAYAIVSWLLIQVADVVLDNIEAPTWVFQAILLLLVIGFPVAIIFAWAFEITPDGLKASSDTQPSERSQQPIGPAFNYFVLALVALAVVFLLVDRYIFTSESSPVTTFRPSTVKPAHLLVKLPPDTYLAVDTNHPTLALSPDGSKLVFAAYHNGITGLYLRELDNYEIGVIDGTEGAAAPFFSPDGEWIGFFTDFVLKKVPVNGGASIAIGLVSGVAVNRGAFWASQEEIIFAGSPNSGLQTISAEQVTLPEVYFSAPTAPYSWPEQLPDGDHVLFTDSSGDDPANTSISVISKETGSVETLIPGGTNSRYSSTGHILYSRNGRLFATPFDVSSVHVNGAEQQLISNLITSDIGAAQFAVSTDATLAYVAGEQGFNEHQLLWVDRDGNTETMLDNRSRLFNPRFSPDGSQLALSISTGSNLDVWVLDIRRGNLARWTTHPGEDFGPVWGPDGRIAYASEIAEDTEGQGPGIAWQVGSGGKPEYLIASTGTGNWDFPASWSPDGRLLAYDHVRSRSLHDIYLFDTETRDSKPYLETPFDERGVRISPDGKWLAYIANDTGQFEVYIRSFPVAGNAVQISVGGGVEPVWSPDGSEIYYRQTNKMMSVALGPDPSENPSTPKILFEGTFDRIFIGGNLANYDVSPSDGRFVMIRRTNTDLPTEIHVVLNWPVSFGLAGE